MTVPQSARADSLAWPLFWQVQLYGLAALIVLNFFPLVHVPTRYLFFTLLITAGVAVWWQGSPLWVRTPIDVPLLALLAWVLITVPFSIDPAYSFKEWRKLGVQVLVFYWTIRVLAKADTRQAIPLLLLAAVVGAGLSSGYATIEFIVRGGIERGRDLRAGALGSDYNWLSTYMVLAIPVTLVAAVGAAVRWRRALALGALGLSCLAELLAFTRGGWAGVAAEALVALWLVGRRRLVVLLLVGGLGAVGGLVIAVNGWEGRETSNVTDPWTLQARANVWQLAAADVVAHPLVGVGYGSENFSKRYAGHPALAKAAGPHSTYVMMAMGSGLPAVGLLLWVFGAAGHVFVQTIRSWQQTPPAYSLLWQGLPPARLLAFGGVVMLVGFAVRNLFEYMLIGAVANLFWMLLAVTLVACSQKVADAEVSS